MDSLGSKGEPSLTVAGPTKAPFNVSGIGESSLLFISLVPAEGLGTPGVGSVEISVFVGAAFTFEVPSLDNDTVALDAEVDLLALFSAFTRLRSSSWCRYRP